MGLNDINTNFKRLKDKYEQIIQKTNAAKQTVSILFTFINILYFFVDGDHGGIKSKVANHSNISSMGS